MSKREKTDSTSIQRDKKVKRVKTQHVKTSVPTISPVNVDCYNLEEMQAKQVANNYSDTFQETSNKLKALFQEIFVMKENKVTDADTRKYKFDVAMNIMALKKLNRIDKHCCKQSRELVNECKQKVDQLNLQYQNLLYEETHLQKEVTKCLEFRSRDEDIELVSEEAFYRDAPANISRSANTKNDNHELTLARLQWELEQRKSLASQLKEAEKKKEICWQNMQALKQRYDDIEPTLQLVQKSVEPLHTILGLPAQTTQFKHSSANFLPSPLYVLYVEACAFAEMSDKKMSFSVEGNVDEAKTLNVKIIDTVEDSGESDTEENVTSKKRHCHSSSAKQRNGTDDVLNKHPLSVLCSLTGEDGSICLEFYYLYNLKIVTVAVKSISPQQMPSVYVGNILKPHKFLISLYPNDYGLESPNPANIYQLKDLDYDVTPFSNEITGWPYIWVQHLCGLHFLDKRKPELEETPVESSKERGSHVEKTFNAILFRLVSRIHLSQQMLSFENGIKIPPEFASICSAGVTSQLKKWGVGLWEEILAHPNHSELMELNIIAKEFFLYKATVQRGSAVLKVLVVISPDYPIQPPVFLLFLHWKLVSTSQSNDTLRELEEEVNLQCLDSLPEEHSHHMLLYQMYHLLMCFDIYLETDHSGDSLEGPNEFLQEKVVTRLYRGRNHGRAYKYIPARRIFTYR